MAKNPYEGGPWGGRSHRPGSDSTPDIDKIIRHGHDRFKSMLPGNGTKIVSLLALVGIAIWLLTGIYVVRADQQGIVLLFGKWVHTTGPGINWYFPPPIGTVEKPTVTTIQEIGIGYRGERPDRDPANVVDVPQESLMLTGDQNIADADIYVLWKIKDAGKYLFNIRNPEATVKIAAESAFREVIGRSNLDDALFKEKETITTEAEKRLQSILDDYGAGIEITQLQLLTVNPPEQVIDAFNEVQRARQDKDRKLNEAETYKNRILPKARGEAEQIIQNAEGYKARVVKDAEGEANRFLAIYENYQQAEEVTKRRLYLETMEEILQKGNMVIIDAEAQGEGGVIPYLPLGELQKNRQKSD